MLSHRWAREQTITITHLNFRLQPSTGKYIQSLWHNSCTNKNYVLSLRHVCLLCLSVCVSFSEKDWGWKHKLCEYDCLFYMYACGSWLSDCLSGELLLISIVKLILCCFYLMLSFLLSCKLLRTSFNLITSTYIFG